MHACIYVCVCVCVCVCIYIYMYIHDVCAVSPRSLRQVSGLKCTTAMNLYVCGFECISLSACALAGLILIVCVRIHR